VARISVAIAIAVRVPGPGIGRLGLVNLSVAVVVQTIAELLTTWVGLCGAIVTVGCIRHVA
jgi:hypothetical protein